MRGGTPDAPTPNADAHAHPAPGTAPRPRPRRPPRRPRALRCPAEDRRRPVALCRGPAGLAAPARPRHRLRLAGDTLSGVWRLLGRCGLRLRSARVQQYSPDPEYAAKVAHLEMCLWEARRYPGEVTAVFLDQMGFARWPDPAPDWGAEAPVA